MNFIELTFDEDGTSFIGNVNMLQAVYVNRKGKTSIIGWGDGVIVVKETYEDVIRKVNAKFAGVNRI
jgi:hypothetical protein